eukprot:TRINITY_DN13303_c0_g1_i1.p2 TRINITY_DN13303_c0_g1~~TRINITY_DN13303_c0_g1_i1.p2  ORF type:complete len:138 (-),score=42.00 TRINITY_DN13303_c0_g1_i1:109-522(-)
MSTTAKASRKSEASAKAPATKRRKSESTGEVKTAITLAKDKELKGTVRYSINDVDAAISSVYVNRAWKKDIAASVKIEVNQDTSKIADGWIKMTKDKEVKNSIRYATSEKDVAVSNVYVNRKFDPMPEAIAFKISAV